MTASFAVPGAVVRGRQCAVKARLAEDDPPAYKAPMAAFRKMHGLGNDFVVFDARNKDFALDRAGARALADRREGIGCDQVIVIAPATGGIDAFMRIYNADGGEVESCGNAARCVARLLMEEGDTTRVRLDSPGGLLDCSDAGGGNVTVDIGEPHLDWREIPLAEAVDTNSFVLTIDGAALTASAVSVGNPHCVLFVEDAERAAVSELGPKIEHHPMFPSRTNVEFVSPVSRTRLRMRVWERGVGITRACGTGACAVAVAAVRRGLAERKVDIVLDGGTLALEWRESDGHVLMTGPVALAYTGDIDVAALGHAS
ncbi:MAG: diaminopimelate epimerase [Rhizomicrobium sp.]|jgi:diaminopimelate epimerase